MASPATQPFTNDQLEKITKDACETTLAAATSYIHAAAASWNSQVINKILQGLLSASESSAPKPQYKYAVNSTIIQHLTDHTAKAPATTTASAGTSTDDAAQQASPPSTPPVGGSEPERGRRGMHSATGAYWNNDTDGMWSFKYEGGEGKGLDVVVSVIWVSVS